MACMDVTIANHEYLASYAHVRLEYTWQFDSPFIDMTAVVKVEDHDNTTLS